MGGSGIWRNLLQGLKHWQVPFFSFLNSPSTWLSQYWHTPFQSLFIILAPTVFPTQYSPRTCRTLPCILSQLAPAPPKGALTLGDQPWPLAPAQQLWLSQPHSPACLLQHRPNTTGEGMPPSTWLWLPWWGAMGPYRHLLHKAALSRWETCTWYIWYIETNTEIGKMRQRISFQIKKKKTELTKDR